MEKITLANLPNQEILKTKADQILGRLDDQTIVASCVKQILKGDVSIYLSKDSHGNLLPTSHPVLKAGGATDYNFLRPEDFYKQEIVIPTVNPSKCLVNIRTNHPIINTMPVVDLYKLSSNTMTVAFNPGNVTYMVYFSYEIIEFY